MRRSTCSSCGRSARPGTRSSAWARSPRAASACSTTSRCARSNSARRRSSAGRSAPSTSCRSGFAATAASARRSMSPARTVILVDDGLATGGTARAALRALRARGPERLVLAVPVGAPETIDTLASECDEVVCLVAPEVMWAIGYWYEDFGQTSDAEVNALLLEAAALSAAEAAPAAPVGAGAADPPTRSEVRIPVPGGEQISRRPRRPRARDGSRRVRARQRLEPPQSTQPRGCRRAEPRRTRDAPHRPAHARGGARALERLRHRAARRAARRGDALGARATRHRRPWGSATSGRAPARVPRCGRRPSSAPTSARSSRAGGAPTSRRRCSPRCAPRRCSSSAASTAS